MADAGGVVHDALILIGGQHIPSEELVRLG